MTSQCSGVYTYTHSDDRRDPSHIDFGYIRSKTRLYYPAPIQCYNWWCFGHTSKRCQQSHSTCGTCSKDHKYNLQRHKTTLVKRRFTASNAIAIHNPYPTLVNKSAEAWAWAWLAARGCTPVSPDQLHLHKEPTEWLLGTNRHPQCISAGDLLFLGNNGTCHVRMQTNEGKGEELMMHWTDSHVDRIFHCIHVSSCGSVWIGGKAWQREVCFCG